MWRGNWKYCRCCGWKTVRKQGVISGLETGKKGDMAWKRGGQKVVWFGNLKEWTCFGLEEAGKTGLKTNCKSGILDWKSEEGKADGVTWKLKWNWVENRCCCVLAWKLEGKEMPGNWNCKCYGLEIGKSGIEVWEPKENIVRYFEKKKAKWCCDLDNGK